MLSRLFSKTKQSFITHSKKKIIKTDAAGDGRGGRHDAQEHRLRQEHAGRVLLPGAQAHRLRQNDRQGQTSVAALPVRGRAHSQGLQERLLQRRRRERVRVQGEVQDHGECHEVFRNPYYGVSTAIALFFL